MEGYVCCGYECVPGELVAMGLPCDLGDGCCPEPMDNCCEEEGAVCCDGMCFTEITMEDVVSLVDGVDTCGDMSCCDSGTLSPLHVVASFRGARNSFLEVSSGVPCTVPCDQGGL